MHAGWSRYVVKDFANTREPTMLAAASDTAVGRVVECKAVKQNYSMFTFDVTSAYTHAWEDELVFLEPPPEKIEMKYVQGIWCGSHEYLKTVKVRDERKLTSIPNKKHLH